MRFPRAGPASRFGLPGWRGLRLATQFLTRIRVAPIERYAPEELSRSAPWFPLVGLAIGVIVAAVLWAGEHRGAPLAAAAALVTWVWITGALHLDGLADLSDALAASHRDPDRFLEVLADPHVGAFGVVSLVLALLVKLAALWQLDPGAGLALLLVPAWARLGPLGWSRWLPALKPGHGERFAWRLAGGWIAMWGFALLLASLALAPVLCAAPLVLVGWGAWLQWRLGGTTGDCLGAGIEVTEITLLVTLAIVGSRGALLTPT